jgi:hypothetical protein
MGSGITNNGSSDIQIQGYLVPPGGTLYLDPNGGPPTLHVATSPRASTQPDPFQDQMENLQKALDEMTYRYGPCAKGGGHTWASYVGFREVYEYCEKCDEKLMEKK